MTLQVGNNNASTMYSGNLSGTGGALTKIGSGTLTLAGANSYTGATSVTAGTLSVSGSLSGSNVTASGSGTFGLSGSLSGSNVSTSGAGIVSEGSTGAIGGTGTTFIQGSSGTSVLAGANTYSGATSLNAGTLQLQANASNTSGGISSALSNSTPALTLAGNTTLALLGNTNGTIFTTASAAANSLTNGVFEASGNGPFNFYVANNGSGSGNTLILANMGQFGPPGTAPTYNLSGANGYTLQLGSGSAGTGALDVFNSTTINSDTAGVTLSIPGGITINYPLAYTLTFGGAGNINLGPLTPDGNNAIPVTYGGTGTLTLSGTNTASGNTTITSGTVNVANTSGLGVTGSTVYLNTSSAALELSTDTGLGGANPLYNISLTNTQQTSATIVLNRTTAGASNSITHNFGTLTLAENGGAAQTLNVTKGAGGTSGLDTIAFAALVGGNNNTVTETLNPTGGNISIGTVSSLSTNASTVTFDLDGTTPGNVITGIISGGTEPVAITKSNTSTWTLLAANTYTGATNITGGTLQLGAGGTTGSIANSSSLTDSGTLAFNRSNAVTQGIDFTASPITGSGAVSQIGTGTLRLNTANTYSGGTTVSSGTLRVTNGTNGSATGLGATLIVADGATFGGNGTVGTASNLVAVTLGSSTGATLFPGLGTSTANALVVNGSLAIQGTNPTLEYNLSSSASSGNDSLTISGALTLPTAGTLDINLLNGVLSTGTYALATAGTISAPANFSGWTINGGDSAHSETLSVANNVLDLNVLLNGLTWTGVPGGGGPATPTGTANTWDVGTSNNWANPSNAASTFTNGAAVSFGDTYTVGGNTAAPTGTVQIQNGGVQPGLVTFSNNAVTYTLTDNDSTNGILGSASVLISGGGTVNFNGPNAYSGGTVITLGTLAAGASRALGTGNVLVNGGTLTESAANALNGASQGLTISSGSVTLSQANSYGGGTTVSSGTLAANAAGALGTGNVLVNGGTLTQSAVNALNGASQSLTVSSGLATLSLANSYDGGTTVSGGTLSVATISDSSTSSIGPSSGPMDNVLTLSGGTLQDATIGSDTTARSVSITSTSTIVVSGSSSASLTLGGTLSGSGGLILGTGTSGTLILAGANSYTGATSVTAGTLGVTGSALGFQRHDQRHGHCLGRNRSARLAAPRRRSLKVRAERSILAGANTYTGATNLNAGTLQLQANSSNTSGGISSASQFHPRATLAANTTLQLLGNTNNTIFEPANSGGAGSNNTGVVEAAGSSGPFNFYVGNNGSGSGNTLILANMGQFGLRTPRRRHSTSAAPMVTRCSLVPAPREPVRSMFSTTRRSTPTPPA